MFVKENRNLSLYPVTCRVQATKKLKARLLSELQKGPSEWKKNIKAVMDLLYLAHASSSLIMSETVAKNWNGLLRGQYQVLPLSKISA